MMDMYSSHVHSFLLSVGLLLLQLLHDALGLTITNTISNLRPRLGETVTLTCNVDGPSTEVVWYKDKTHDSFVFVALKCTVIANDYKSRLTSTKCDTNNYDFQLSNVKISDRGEWLCEGDGHEPTTKLNLDVLVPPLSPTVTNPSPLKVGETAKFTCSAENENVTKPVTYTWTKNGNTLSPGTIEPGALLFSSVKKSNAGKYVCVATNEAGSKASTEQDFVVHYAPDSVQLKTTTASNSKSESETETFTCEAIGGNPVPSVKLLRQEGTRRETLIEERKRVLIFRRQMMRQDNQVKFYCEATGPGIPNYMLSRMITYNVLFPHTVQVKISKTTVNEHEFVRFECASSGGNPEQVTRYQWLWKKSGTTTEQVIQDIETSTQNGQFLEFMRIQYDKSGTYYCKAWNKGGMEQASTVLNVQYSPRIDPDAKMTYDVAGQVGKATMFELFIIANPTPDTTGYTWSKDGNVISTSSPDYEITSGPKFSKLKIKDIKSSDYKNYICSVKTSGFQANVFQFKLLKAGPPSAPSNLKVVNSSAVAATLEWISGFPGGSEQRFYVQYKKAEDNWDIAYEVPQGGITDPGLKKGVNHKVMNLESNVYYVFRVHSKNSQPGPNTSDFSNIASGKTPEPPQTSVLGVSRAGEVVTMRWKRLTRKYTAIKVRYCETGTEDCLDLLVRKPEDNYASFLVNADKTYYYYMIVEDGGDVVYMTNPQVDDDKTKVGNIGMIAGIVGGGVVLSLVVFIVIAIILRKRKPRSKEKREAQELQNMASQNDAQSSIMRHHVPAREVLGNESASFVDDPVAYDYVNSSTTQRHGVSENLPTSSGADVDAYDYIDIPTTTQQSVLGNVPVTSGNDVGSTTAGQQDVSGKISLANRMDPDYATPYEITQRGQEAENTREDPRTLTQRGEPYQCAAESGPRQTDGSQELTPSLSSDDAAHGHEAPYEHLGQVEAVNGGVYLDFLELSPVQLKPV